MVVVEGDELQNQIVEMPLAEDDEFVQALPAYRPDEPFASAVQIGRSLWQRVGFHSCVRNRLGELFREFHVSVVQDHLRLLLPILRLFHEPFRLLADPCRIGMCRGFGDEDFPCLQAQKHQHVEIMDSFGRH